MSFNHPLARGFKEWLLTEGFNRKTLEAMLRKKSPYLGQDQIDRQVALAVGADPSPEKNYVMWIAKQWLAGAIRLPEDNGQLSVALNWFAHNKPVLKRAGKPLDIFKYTKDQLYAAEAELSGQLSGRRQAQADKQEGAERIYEDGRWLVMRVTQGKAACFYARGTKWCTSDEDTADQYIKEGPLYVFYRAEEGGWKVFAQLHLPSGQLMDVLDRPLGGGFLSEPLPEGMAEIITHRIPYDQTDHRQVRTVAKLTDTLDQARPQINKLLRTAKGFTSEDFDSVDDLLRGHYREAPERPRLTMNEDGVNWACLGHLKGTERFNLPLAKRADELHADDPVDPALVRRLFFLKAARPTDLDAFQLDEMCDELERLYAVRHLTPDDYRGLRRDYEFGKKWAEVERIVRRAMADSTLGTAYYPMVERLAEPDADGVMLRPNVVPYSRGDKDRPNHTGFAAVLPTAQLLGRLDYWTLDRIEATLQGAAERVAGACEAAYEGMGEDLGRLDQDMLVKDIYQMVLRNLYIPPNVERQAVSA